MAGALEWSAALAVIRSTYREGAAYSLPRVSPTGKQRLILTEAVARQVLDNASDYPVSLWSMAEATASASARKTLRSVSHVAKLDHWFEM